MKKYILILLLSVCSNIFLLSAQPKQQAYSLKLSPVSQHWNYEKGEDIYFQIIGLAYDQPINEELKMDYQFSFDGYDPLKSGTVKLKNGQAKVGPFKVKKPGFYVCKVTAVFRDEPLTAIAKTGYQVEDIVPVTPMPNDFQAFWQEQLKEAREIPLKPKMTLLTEYCTADIDVYHIEFQNIKEEASWRGNSKMYGILNIPKNAKGKLPVIVQYPGAGVRPYAKTYDMANKGVIFLQMGIHGIPVNMNPSVYDDLATGALAGYYFQGLDHRETYYYRRVILGCVKAIDFVERLPEADPEKILVTGGSQGGALSIIVTALHPAVKGVASHCPALSDMMGWVGGQTGGWPKQFKQYDQEIHPNWTSVAPYYDVVNFAKTIKVSGFYFSGLNDRICPPMPFFAMYNSVTAPKSLALFPNSNHWEYPAEKVQADNWLLSFFDEQ